MPAIKHKVTDQTLAFWQLRSARTLCAEDARQMVENVSGFFSLLTEWVLIDRLHKDPEHSPTTEPSKGEGNDEEGGQENGN
jgi:hypothetical protein